MGLQDEALLILDGACGTSIQHMALPASVWGGHEGCNEYLNLSAPDAVVELHRSFLEAGAMAIETNSFGANRIVLAEYGLEGEVVRINEAAVANAREAIGGGPGFVIGSIGPGTKLPSLGHVAVQQLAAAIREQAHALLEGGVDALILETCQDLLQVKTGLVSIFELLEEQGRKVPVMVSITVETTGTMLVGTEVAAAAAALEPFDLFSLGLNCATGPELMKSHVHYLSRTWPGRISVVPNAGMPRVEDGKTVYPLDAGAFAAHQKGFVQRDGVSVVGGCCGTTPEHIRALAGALRGVSPARRTIERTPSISSAYQAVELRQDIPPLLIGERANANGSKKFRELLLADDYQGALRIGLEQESEGAHAADLCTAYAGRDECRDLTTLGRLFAESVRLPLVIDSTTPACVEEVLKLYPGRCVINSINLEDGGERLDVLCRLARKYGAALIALTIHEKGMAMSADEKVATARAIYDRAVGANGLRAEDLLFDPLTFTVGSGDEALRNAARETLEAVKRIKQELPGVGTSLGVSNVSFGLSTKSRKVLNSVFLHEAVAVGLDAAIVHAGKVIPFAKIDEEDRAVCLDLIYNRDTGDRETPLERFIAHFAERTEEADEEEAEKTATSVEHEMTRKIVDGDKEGVEDLLSILLARRTATSIVNEILVPAMRYVGELFGRGEMLLPFVLKSAEVMKHGVSYLEPYLDAADNDAGLTVLLATVQGDVHDIGKNLVDIIFSNNGYTVINLGTKVPAERVIEEAKKHRVDVIGLSGLLVKSAVVMSESMPEFEAAGLRAPVLLGGAALTRAFVARSCVPGYTAPVVYCPDAFAGLKALEELREGKLSATTYDETAQKRRAKPGVKTAVIGHDNRVPEPPFVGTRHVEDIDPALLFSYINEQALFRGRWGYRRGTMSAGDYRELVTNTVRPLYERLKREVVEERLVTPKAAYGYFRCWSGDDAVVVEHEGNEYRFDFPRQSVPPHLCIADFYKSREVGGDIAPFFVVTIGEAMARRTAALYESDAYHDYLVLHALSVELTDALAEYWHERIRRELGIDERPPDSPTGYVVQEYRGSRYGFGYPACPDLEAHKHVFALLRPEAIGVSLTENMQMVPEQTTSAIVAHHPQAKYFAV